MRLKHITEKTNSAFGILKTKTVLMDLLLLGSYTRLSRTLIKWNLLLAKITIIPSTLFITFPPLHWMNELTNKWCPCWQSKMTTSFPCHNIHLYYISITKVLNFILKLHGKVFKISKLVSITVSIFNIIPSRLFTSSVWPPFQLGYTIYPLLK